MKKFNITLLAAALALASGAAAAQAAATSEVAYGSLSGSVITFSELADGHIDSLLTSGGVQFGERFAGQEMAVAKAPRPGEVAQDWFDDLSFGSPTAGLTLLAGAAGANLAAFDYGNPGGTSLYGMGPLSEAAEGLGAISARFAAPVSALGFELVDANGGAITLSLYRLDGSLIQNLDLSGRHNGFVAFSRAGGTADIAGFSLTNRDDYYGVSIDNLVLSAAPVPEPGSYALMLAGMAVVAGVVRRRRSTQR